MSQILYPYDRQLSLHFVCDVNYYYYYYCITVDFFTNKFIKIHCPIQSSLHDVSLGKTNNRWIG